VQLLRSSGAKSLLTVPSILEEIALLPSDEGIKTLQSLHFVAFGGGLPKETIGNKLTAAGVKLLNHYGATETGPLAPLFVPPPDYDWHYFKLRTDIWEPLQVHLDSISEEDGTGRKWQLSLQPLGWTERFHVQDILVSRPHSETEFCVTGRSDDLIRLATGEKVRPTILESMLAQSEAIKAAVAFGDGQCEIGVLVEPMRPIAAAEHDHFKSTLWLIVEKAREQMDFHAHVSSPSAVVIVQPGSLPRSDKGTILRREVYQRFETEIADVYHRLDSANGSLPPLQMDFLERDLRTLIRDNLSWKIQDETWADDGDFFELGMDSLQATNLRRLLTASLLNNLAGDDNNPLANISRDFVYQHSSIAKLASALRLGHAKSNGPGSEDGNLDDLITSFCMQCSAQSRNPTTAVLLTGSTGSLGAHLLVHLARATNVDRVFCINRPSEQNPYARQEQALKSKGLRIPEGAWSKIEILQTDASACRLGLPEEDYARLQEEVTHILHTAWPMNFKLQISSFNAQFRVLQHLLMLARESHARSSYLKPRVLFTSSISVVGRYGNISDETIVPEIPIRNSNSSLHLGYAKAKLVCEQIMERARKDIPEIEVGYVRVGQIAGAQSGFWNADEHFVALIASSQKIGKLPIIQGVRDHGIEICVHRLCLADKIS
jgi:nucleoside-diphosphate-sugar epimerase